MKPWVSSKIGLLVLIGALSAIGVATGTQIEPVREIVVIGGVLDHAVQRDVFVYFELSQLRFSVAN